MTVPPPNSSDPSPQRGGTETGRHREGAVTVKSAGWDVHSGRWGVCTIPTAVSCTQYALAFQGALCSEDRDQLPAERRSCFRAPIPTTTYFFMTRNSVRLWPRPSGWKRAGSTSGYSARAPGSRGTDEVKARKIRMMLGCGASCLGPPLDLLFRQMGQQMRPASETSAGSTS